MTEVTCRVFDAVFQAMAEKGVAPERLVDGTSLTLGTLRNKHERISWDDFRKTMTNAHRFLDDEELVRLGGSFSRSAVVRFAAVASPLLFSAMDFYAWVNQPGKGVGRQLFACVTATQRQVGPDRIEVDLALDEGYEPCWEFFLVTKGTFTEMPKFLGLPSAKVELTRTPRGARYDIVVPAGGVLLPRLRRALRFPLNLRGAASELKLAHEALQQRYLQLEEARAQLDQQAARLRTAHAISETIHGDLDLDRTLDAVTYALLEDAGFSGVEVHVSTSIDGVTIDRTASRGVRAGAMTSRPLVGGGGRRLGSIVAHASGARGHDREELLDFVLPTLSMALENAISYRVLEEYRAGLERRVVERTTELSHARDALAETVRDLEDANATRDRIFANINHEIRTPLSLILLAVERARDADGPAVRELEVIASSARRLLRLVDELLILAEGREGELQLRIATTDLGDLVARNAEAWRTAATAGGLHLEVDAPKGLLVAADANAVERVLSNLLSNAVKYTPRGGGILVRVARSGGSATLEVSDSGIGIDADLRPRLFGRFERGRKAIERGIPGSGLGLSLVQDLVQAQGGRIEVSGRAEGGTRFLVTWPTVGAASGATESSSLELAPGDFGVTVAVTDERTIYECATTAKATVLLAEDEPLLRHEIATVLAEEYRVLAAASGDEALRLAELHQPDILVTDVAMPNMDGIELTRRFLALRANRVAPVLVLTAYGEIRDRLAGFDAGAVDYIVKPFESTELRARIRSQLAVRSLALKLLDAERLAAVGRLSAGLAHEIRNPANGILNAIEPLRDALAPADLSPSTAAGQLLDVVESCSRQIAVLSRELLGFRRGAQLQRTGVRLDALLRRARASVWSPGTGVELREVLAYDGTVACAEPLMQQVFSNLLDNAIQAAGSGGWVEVRSSVEGTLAVIEFRDSGPGVPDAIRDKVWEPFFTTKPAGSGTGLGLATSREIVERHGGSLDLRGAAPDTVFRLEIPLEAP